MASKHRFDEMLEFFDGVGTGPTSGIWEDTPRPRPEFKVKPRKVEKSIGEENGAC